MRLTVLTRDDLARLVRMPDAIALMREAFAEIGRGTADVPDRVALGLHGDRDTVLFMPGHLRERGAVGVKVVSVFPENVASRAMPAISAIVLLIDVETGEPRAVMDGTYITALRTGAVSGLATDLLARQDARVLAVYGAGAQARTQVEAILHVRSIDTVLIHTPSRTSAEALAAELSARHGTRCVVSVADDPDAAAARADVIVTATSSATPVFDGRRLKGGTHINAIGSFKPSMREVDDVTVTRASLFVDERAAALREAGDLLIPIAAGLLRPSDVRADLGDLVLGRHPGRQHADEVTCFKSVGHAAGDLIVASEALRRAAGSQRA